MKNNVLLSFLLDSARTHGQKRTMAPRWFYLPFISLYRRHFPQENSLAIVSESTDCSFKHLAYSCFVVTVIHCGKYSSCTDVIMWSEFLSL